MSARDPDPSILKEYDVRGTFGLNLFEEDALWLGERFGTFVYGNGGRAVTVCGDGRHSSPALSRELVEGLRAAGLDVIDIGVGPTPMSYFSGHELRVDATLMVTGSHNPPADNGVKLTFKNRPFFAEALKNLRFLDFVRAPKRGELSVAGELFTAYVERLSRASVFEKPLSVAWDAGNGAAGEVIEALTKRLPGHRHVSLFTEIDGSFPNHHPDPSVESNLSHLRQAVLDNGCDVGFAFDGDGDRVGVVDSNGDPIMGDRLVALVAREILALEPGATIIADVKCGAAVFETIEKYGGNAIMERTGHARIKEAMLERNAAFAGEMSGHLFFKRDYYGFDDGIYAAVFLLNHAQTATGGLARAAATLPKPFGTPEYRLPCQEPERTALVEDLKRRLAERNETFLAIDGVRVTSKKGWWLVRASNTQNALVVRAEAKTKEWLEDLLDEIEGFGFDLREGRLGISPRD